jgi:integrase
MSTELKPVKGYKNLYYKNHATRKHGVRYDRYFVFRYTLNGKRIKEAIGWESEGHKPNEFYNTFLMLKENRKTGTYPQTFKEYREAKQKENAGKLTLSEYFPIFYSDAQISKKQVSYVKEEQHFRLHIQPIAGTLMIEEITPAQYQLVVDSIRDKTPRTQRYVLGTFRRILLSAFDKGYLPQEPPSTRTVKIKRQNNERSRLITEEEKSKILAELQKRSEHAYRLTLFCFLTGCRFSEAANLKWTDVNTTTLTFRDTKNKDHRTIHLTEAVKELINSIERDKDHIFVMANGEQWKQPPETFKTVCKPFNEDREKNDRIVFHSIRHYVATKLSHQLTVKELQDIMGWKDPQMAMRYMKPDKDRQLKAMELLS